MNRGTSNRLKARIEQSLKSGDKSRAHVLLHSLAGIYQHTPYPIRERRLTAFAELWPELVKECLDTCCGGNGSEK